MRSRHLVDPEILPTLEVLPPLNLSLQSLEAVRASYAALAEKYWSTIPLDMTGLKLTEHRIPGAPGDPMVRVLVIRCDRSPLLCRRVRIRPRSYGNCFAQHSFTRTRWEITRSEQVHR
jgi:hypothetical protein